MAVKKLKRFDEVKYKANPTNPIYERNGEELGDFEVLVKQGDDYVSMAFDPVKPGTLVQHLSCAKPVTVEVTLEPGRTKEVTMVPCAWRNGSSIMIPMRALEFVEGEYGEKKDILDIPELTPVVKTEEKETEEDEI